MFVHSNVCTLTYQKCFDVKFIPSSKSAVMPEPGGPGGPLASPPPIFGRSVNPITTGEGRLSAPITTGTLNVFHLPASLWPLLSWRKIQILSCFFLLKIKCQKFFGTSVSCVTIVNTVFPVRDHLFKFQKAFLLKLNYCKKVFFFLNHLFARDVLVMKSWKSKKLSPFSLYQL